VSSPDFELKCPIATDQLEVGAVGGNQASAVRPRRESDEHVKVQVLQFVRRKAFVGLNLPQDLARLEPASRSLRRAEGFGSWIPAYAGMTAPEKALGVQQRHPRENGGPPWARSDSQFCRRCLGRSQTEVLGDLCAQKPLNAEFTETLWPQC